MSEDQGDFDPSRGHSAATDPHHTATAGEPGTQWHDAHPAPGGGLSEVEVEHNRMMFGVTYRERYGRQREGTCVTYCRAPGQKRRGVRCPICYGPVAARTFDEAPDVDPGPARAERLAGWVGSWVAAFREAVTLPFRRDADHTRALIVNVLREMLEAGLRAEFVVKCPSCGSGDRPESVSVEVAAGERS